MKNFLALLVFIFASIAQATPAVANAFKVSGSSDLSFYAAKQNAELAADETCSGKAIRKQKWLLSREDGSPSVYLANAWFECARPSNEDTALCPFSCSIVRSPNNPADDREEAARESRMQDREREEREERAELYRREHERRERERREEFDRRAREGHWRGETGDEGRHHGRGR